MATLVETTGTSRATGRASGARVLVGRCAAGGGGPMVVVAAVALGHQTAVTGGDGRVRCTVVSGTRATSRRALASHHMPARTQAGAVLQHRQIPHTASIRSPPSREARPRASITCHG